MADLEYKTIAAPRRAQKVKGVKGADERYAHTIGEIIDEQAAKGWRYLQADTFHFEEKNGFFSAARSVARTVLIFCRDRAQPVAAQPPAAAPARRAAPAEPAFSADAEPAPAAAPQLGGAERA